MDENNSQSNDSENKNTTDANNQVNENTAKPSSAFDMPSDTKVSTNLEQSTIKETPAAQVTASYYTSPENRNQYHTGSTPVNNESEVASTGFALASLILGILSIPTSCCCGLGLLFSILGIIFGCLQPKDSYDKKPGMAIAGIVTSCVGILCTAIAIICLMLYGQLQDMYAL